MIDLETKHAVQRLLAGYDARQRAAYSSLSTLEHAKRCRRKNELIDACFEKVCHGEKRVAAQMKRDLIRKNGYRNSPLKLVMCEETYLRRKHDLIAMLAAVVLSTESEDKTGEETPAEEQKAPQKAPKRAPAGSSKTGSTRKRAAPKKK